LATRDELGAWSAHASAPHVQLSSTQALAGNERRSLERMARMTNSLEQSALPLGAAAFKPRSGIQTPQRHSNPALCVH
jgi:hypothetical protein